MQENTIYPCASLDLKEGDIIAPLEIRINIFGLFESEEISDEQRYTILKSLISYIDDVRLLKDLKKEIALQIKSK